MGAPYIYDISRLRVKENIKTSAKEILALYEYIFKQFKPWFDEDCLRFLEQILLLLLLLALQPTVGFSLLSDSLPFSPFFTLLSPSSYSHYLHIFFDIYNPSLPWSTSNSRNYRFPL